MSLLAWLRRLAVSLGVGVTSYAIMLGIMLASVLFDREAEPVITLVSNAGRSIVNHLRERVNMTHVLLSIPAVLIASVVVGIPLNKVLGGTRTALQRVAIALTSVPATVVLAVVLFSFNAMFPGTYASLLRFADWVWQLSLDALSASGDTIPGARKLTNVARQGFTGHHYVIMALCSVAASFLVNVAFALAFRTRHDEPLPHEVPSSYA
jgi:hypothetical protein